MALSRVSTALEFQGRFTEADTVLQAATALFERHGYGAESVRADHLDQRGRLLNRAGRYDEALLFLEESLAIHQAAVPPNDSALAYAYANLAVVQSDLGRNAVAETLLVAAVAAARRAHGDVHPLVAAVMSPLATVQERAGRPDAALATYRAVIDMRRELLGEEHPDYAWTMFNYADQLLQSGRPAEAAEWARRVLALHGRTLEDEHPAVATAMGVLGRALGRMDSLAAGEHWLRESLALRRSVLPPGHWLLSSSESMLGEHLALSGRFAEAERMLLTAERALVAARGEEAPVIRDVRLRIVKLYELWGRPGDAAAWRAKLPAG
jgi:tetratricopeptide (TPR) repeat protein